MSRYTYFSLFFIVVAISLFSSHVVYQEYKNSQYQAAVQYLSSKTAHNAEAIKEWLLSRQNEMRFISNSKAAKNIEKKQLENLLVNIADLNGDYDTIFFIDLEGRGVVGVDHKNNETRVLPSEEARAFFVQDRAWFKRVSEGSDTFSEPLVSRATGQRVSTVSVPVYQADKFVGIIRGAVLLSSLLDKVNNIQKTENSEVFLIDQRGSFVTPSKAMLNGMLQSQSQAVDAIKEKTDWTGSYRNDLGDEVIGSVVHLSLLNWGLVYEVNKDFAMNDVYETFRDILILGVLSILFAVMMFSVFFRDPKEMLLVRTQKQEEMEKAALKLSQSALSSSDVQALTQSPELVAKLEAAYKKIDQSLSVLPDMNSRLNLAAMGLEQIIQEKDSPSSQQLSSLLKDLRFVDTKLKLTEKETKGLLQEQNWLIEQLKNLSQK